MENKEEILKNSPLQEVNERSLDEFLSRDPFEYSKLDRVEVIKLLRKERERWELLETQGKRQSKSSAKGETKSKELPKAMDLGDLFGEGD